MFYEIVIQSNWKLLYFLSFNDIILKKIKRKKVNNMKILITGANGMLAKEVKEKFAIENEIITTDVAELDITNEEAVLEYVTNLKPDYIITQTQFIRRDN